MRSSFNTLIPVLKENEGTASKISSKLERTPSPTIKNLELNVPAKRKGVKRTRNMSVAVEVKVRKATTQQMGGQPKLVAIPIVKAKADSQYRTSAEFEDLRQTVKIESLASLVARQMSHVKEVKHFECQPMQLSATKKLIMARSPMRDAVLTNPLHSPSEISR